MPVMPALTQQSPHALLQPSGQPPAQLPAQPELFPRPAISLEELFEAYIECRRHKRRTANARAFELDYETNLVQLLEEINSGSWRPGRSVTFIVDKPVKREIFAADFRDRVVHHLLIRKINPLMERDFIYDSYACRVGKGSHLGIARLGRFMRQCSANGTQDPWALKLDIQGFFMSINRQLLAERLTAFLSRCYDAPDRELVINLARTIALHDPTRHCLRRCPRSAWCDLPPDKSLFHTPAAHGLPIGNLTSQVFANFYLNPLDHFIKHSLGMRYYGRYVDDFVIVHHDRAVLAALVPSIRAFLQTELGLTLHPRKLYLQPCRHGVPFLGMVVYPGHVAAGDRVKANFKSAVSVCNVLSDNHRPDRDERAHFRSSINSYLGILAHYHTFRLRCAILEGVNPWWLRLFRADRQALHVVSRP
ncbi:MAG: RNA-directed DNA polymerase [Spirochaetota bacterium]